MQEREVNRTAAQVGKNIEVGDWHEVDCPCRKRVSQLRSHEKSSCTRIRMQRGIVNAIEAGQPDADKADAGATFGALRQRFGKEVRLTGEAGYVHLHAGPEQTGDLFD